MTRYQGKTPTGKKEAAGRVTPAQAFAIVRKIKSPKHPIGVASHAEAVAAGLKTAPGALADPAVRQRLK